MPNGLKYVGWTVTIGAAAVFLVMLLVTVPHLMGMTNGEPIFDLRLLGYDFPTAEGLVAHLGNDGAVYYGTVQHRLDAIFAVLFCLALVYWLIVAARNWQGHGLPLGSAVLGAVLATAVIANAADLGENAAVSAMLAVGTRGLTNGMVETASVFTLARTFFTTIACLALVVLGLGPFAARLFMGRRK